jgi:putative tryptophan/tyrosine transport system substrate-binding protein
LLDRRAQIVELAARHTLPAIYHSRQFPESGGLMSYATDGLDQFRQAGLFAGYILKGGKPADMPMMQATKFELVIDLRAARAIGATVPPLLLSFADEVIE